MKQCIKCGEWKEKVEFETKKKIKLSRFCAKCKNENLRAARRRQKNAYFKKHPDKLKKKNEKKRLKTYLTNLLFKINKLPNYHSDLIYNRHTFKFKYKYRDGYLKQQNKNNTNKGKRNGHLDYCKYYFGSIRDIPQELIELKLLQMEAKKLLKNYKEA